MTGTPRLFDPAPDRRRIGRVRRGFDTTLAAARARELADPIDAARVALARVLADELDATIADPDESRYTVATVAGRYRDALADMLTAFGLRDDRDELTLADMLAALPDAPNAVPADDR